MPSFTAFPDLTLPHAFQPFAHDGAKQPWTRYGMAVWHCLVDLLRAAASLEIAFSGTAVWRSALWNGSHYSELLPLA